MTLPVIPVPQPHAFAIATGAQQIVNLKMIAGYRGYLAIYAYDGISVYERDGVVTRIAETLGRPERDVSAGARTQRAVVAVAHLTDVCSAGRNLPWYAPPECDCGPWAVNGHYHWRLTEVRRLAQPVPAPAGNVNAWWVLPDDIEKQVRATADRATNRPEGNHR